MQEKFWTKIGKSNDYVKKAKRAAGKCAKSVHRVVYARDWKKGWGLLETYAFCLEVTRVRKMPLDELLKNSAYEMYIRYASRYDNHLFESLQKGERLVIVTKGGKNEMHTKMSI
ncbi:hypothetical protein L914_03330 [Phytophthora nicotianae]|uniref:Uncharacterized protein n=1 Tax=Phytophthora nicotianae TaxID=4792 RepID=W2NXF8_PHYNI|nr:hypothetical protein L914_03330 [Phytophthora nicotianae]